MRLVLIVWSLPTNTLVEGIFFWHWYTRRLAHSGSSLRVHSYPGQSRQARLRGDEEVSLASISFWALLHASLHPFWVCSRLVSTLGSDPINSIAGEDFPGTGTRFDEPILGPHAAFIHARVCPVKHY